MDRQDRVRQDRVMGKHALNEASDWRLFAKAWAEEGDALLAHQALAAAAALYAIAGACGALAVETGGDQLHED